MNKHESAQDEVECLDEADYSLERKEFENQYYQVENNFNAILYTLMDTPSRPSSTRSRLSGHCNHNPRSIKVAHTLSYLPLN